MILEGPSSQIIRDAVSAALEEDGAHDDVTVSFLNIGERIVAARLLSLSSGVLAGIDVARAAFHELDPKVTFAPLVKDGSHVDNGRVLAEIEGRAAGVLSAERVALNFLQRLSGIATLTSRFVEKVSGTGIKILDTRKTTPRLRALEKYAVRVGGGDNHRFDLSEMILVKENHIRSVGGIESLIQCLHSVKPPARVEVEVDTLEFLDALAGTAVERVMLDNFTPDMVREAVRRLEASSDKHGGPKPEVEVSGGITLDNIAQYAVPGVKFISIGALTHSAVSLNMSIEVD